MKMFFGISRVVIVGIVFLFIFLIAKKRNVVKFKIVVSLALILCVVLCSLSFLFPVENLFIRFKSPESVFNYCQSGKVVDIIHGDNSSMVIYTEGNSSSGHFIVPKSTKGYKIQSLLSVKKVSQKFDRDGSFDVYNVLGTKDYYVVGTTISNDSTIDIVDSNNNTVKTIIVNMGSSDTKTVFVYSFVENFTSEYYFVINGKKIGVSI